MRLFTFTLALSLCFTPLADAQDASAKQEAGWHPVLIGKQQNEVVTVLVQVDQPTKLLGATFTFEEGTDLEDIDRVDLLEGIGRKSSKEFRPIGEPRAAAREAHFQSDYPLSAGEHRLVFSCRLSPKADLSHRIQATCTEIKTSGGTIMPEGKSGNHLHRIGYALRQAGDDGVHTYRIPVLATTSKGTLLCAYDVRRRNSSDLQGDIDVGLRRSTDGGRHWEPQQIIMDIGTYGGLPEAQNGCGDPGLIVDQQTGEIFCFALWVHAKPGKHQWRGDGSEPGYEIGKTAQFMLVRSSDDGVTWSQPENLTRQLKKEEWILLAPSPQQGIQLRDGTLVMPIQGRDGDGPFASIMRSEDHGKSWHLSERAYSGGNECQAAELGDGSIMLNIRNGAKKKRAVVVTSDRGKTWSLHPTHEGPLIEPTCNGSLYRWTSVSKPSLPALLLFANPYDRRGRINYSIQVSTDDGMTWPPSRRLLLDEGLGFGYPSMSRVDDEFLGIVYEGSQANLVYEKISREELMEKHGGKNE